LRKSSYIFSFLIDEFGTLHLHQRDVFRQTGFPSLAR
jgi:hypothetical protein